MTLSDLGIIALHLGTPRTRHWWNTVGRIGFNPEFVEEVDTFIADRKAVTRGPISF